MNFDQIVLLYQVTWGKHFCNSYYRDSVITTDNWGLFSSKFYPRNCAKIFSYRNDILIIAIQLAQEMPQLPFIESGFAKELLLFATYPESKFSFLLQDFRQKIKLFTWYYFISVKNHSPLIKRLKLTTCYEDFELKKLFFNFAVTISKNANSNQVSEIYDSFFNVKI